MDAYLRFGFFGNTSLYYELNNIVPIMDIMSAEGAPAAIVATINNLPIGGTLLLLFFIVFCFIFLATTIDSAAYTLSTVSLADSKAVREPARWIRLFWGGVLCSVSVILLYGNGLDALQTLAVITGFPILFIYIIVTLSLFKWLKEDHPGYKTQKFNKKSYSIRDADIPPANQGSSRLDK